MRLLNRLGAGALALVLACVTPAPACAATLPFTALPTAPALLGPELIPCQTGGVTYACTAAQIIALANLGALQPLDSDLTAIAALTTTPFGRSQLTVADAPGERALLGVSATGTDATYLARSSNLSDVGNPASARANIGAGTVTTVSIVTANGVSGTVASASTAPSISITLGAITPSSVTATGAIAASNFSGSSSGVNTGDQTSVSGNAGTATKLATVRRMYLTGDVVSTFTGFDGSADITSTVTLTAVNANVGNCGGASAIPIVALDAKGRATACTTTAVGNAATATKLAAPVNINGVGFDGSAAITIPAVDIATPRQPLAANLTAVAGLSTGTDQCEYWTGSSAASLYACTSYGRPLVGAVNAAAAQSLLALVPGTNVQAFSANLLAEAGLGTAADQCSYWTGSAAAALTACPSFGRSLMGASSALSAQTILGLVPGTNVQMQSAILQAVANLANISGQVVVFAGAGTATTLPVSTWRYSAPLPTGQYMTPGGIGGVVTAGIAPGAGTIRFFLGYVRKDGTITGVGLRVATVYAGGNVQIAIYAMDGTTSWPTGSPLVTSASLSTTTATGVADTTVNYAIKAGWYWFATNCDNATAAFYSMNSNGAASDLSGATSITNAFSGNGQYKTQTFGAWPALTGNKANDGLTDTVTNMTPLVAFKL